MDVKKIEQNALKIGIVMNLFMGISGLIVYHMTKIEALFIDSYYTIIALFTGLVAIIISRTSHKRNKDFPHGFFILEPLYALVKSLLSLFLLTISTVTITKKAYLYFFEGKGEIMNVGPVIPYSLLMFCIGIIMSHYYKRQNEMIANSSTMLQSESKSTLVDATLSAGIGIATILVWLLDENSALGFLKYTGDFFMTIILVALTIKEPLAILRSSLVEIAGGTLRDGKIKKGIVDCVTTVLGNHQVMADCLVYKTGKSLKVHLVMDQNKKEIDLEFLSQKKTELIHELKKHFEFIEVIYVF